MSWDETQYNRIKWNEDQDGRHKNKLNRARMGRKRVARPAHPDPVPTHPNSLPQGAAEDPAPPIFLLVVLSQVCMSSMAAGMATLPAQVSGTPVLHHSILTANLLMGCLTIPLAIVGIVVGSILGISASAWAPCTVAPFACWGAVLPDPQHASSLLGSLPIRLQASATSLGEYVSEPVSISWRRGARGIGGVAQKRPGQWS